MKKKILFMMAAMMICLAALLCVKTPTQAAARVTKVEKTAKYTASKAQFTIKGKTSSGKVVWTWKSSKYAATELSAVSFITKGDYVYIIADRKYICLSKQTGKVKKSTTPIPKNGGSWSATMYVDGERNLYLMGFYGSNVYKINAKGKLVWTAKIDNDYYWPFKMTKVGKYIKISFDNACGEDCNTVKVRMKDGKVIY